MSNRKELNPLLLIIPPALSVNEPQPGPAFLAASIRKEGGFCCVLDLNINLYNSAPGIVKREIWHNGYALWSNRESYIRLIKPWTHEFMESIILKTIEELRVKHGISKPVLGFSCSTASFPAAAELSLSISEKRPDLYQIMGGPFSNILKRQPERLKNTGFNSIVIGEGEMLLPEILEALFINEGKSSQNENNLQNLYWADNTTQLNGRKFFQAYPLPPDTIPIPDFSDLKLSEYSGRTVQTGHGPSLPTMLTRGCPGRCAFCSETHLYSPDLKNRDTRELLDEIEDAVNRLNIRIFYFCDLSINGAPYALEELLLGIIHRKIDISWISEARPDRTLSSEMAELMKLSGCHSLGFGLESGSSRLLGLMRKGFNASEAEKAIKNAAEAGIHTSINLMAGFPGTTPLDTFKTLLFLYKNRNYIGSVSTPILTCTLAPDTPIGQKPESFGIRLPFVKNSSKRNIPLSKSTAESYSDKNNLVPYNGWESRWFLNNPATRIVEQQILYYWAEFLGLSDGPASDNRGNMLLSTALEWKEIGFPEKAAVYAFLALTGEITGKALSALSRLKDRCTEKKHNVKKSQSSIPEAEALILDILGSDAFSIIMESLSQTALKKKMYHTASCLLSLSGQTSKSIAPMLLENRVFWLAERHILRIKPDKDWYAESRRSLGWIFEKRNRTSEAVKAYREALDGYRKAIERENINEAEMPEGMKTTLERLRELEGR